MWEAFLFFFRILCMTKPLDPQKAHLTTFQLFFSGVKTAMSFLQANPPFIMPLSEELLTQSV